MHIFTFNSELEKRYISQISLKERKFDQYEPIQEEKISYIISSGIGLGVANLTLVFANSKASLMQGHASPGSEKDEIAEFLFPLHV